ncbi:MAG: DUF1178 family protein [Silicimonas sp.]|nr:DUF1178 family protein [Silicimonas sp.]
MIRFDLECAAGHGFESWFPSNDTFDTLVAAGQVLCPVCNSKDVQKALMAPPVRASRKKAVEPATQPMVNSDDPDLKKAVQAIREHVEKNSDYVGDRFVEEARAMHDGDAPQRSIHGQARPEEAKKLIEDGVPAVPLPFIPKQKTN